MLAKTRALSDRPNHNRYGYRHLGCSASGNSIRGSLIAGLVRRIKRDCGSERTLVAV